MCTRARRAQHIFTLRVSHRRAPSMHDSLLYHHHIWMLSCVWCTAHVWNVVHAETPTHREMWGGSVRVFILELALCIIIYACVCLRHVWYSSHSSRHSIDNTLASVCALVCVVTLPLSPSLCVKRGVQHQSDGTMTCDANMNTYGTAYTHTHPTRSRVLL